MKEEAKLTQHPQNLHNRSLLGLQVLDGGYLLLGDVLAGLDQAIATFPEFVVEEGLVKPFSRLNPDFSRF